MTGMDRILGWMDGWVDGKDGWMDGWKDEQLDGLIMWLNKEE